MSFLSDSPQFLKGVGPRRVQALAKAGVRNVGDLFRYYPRRYLDRSTTTRIRDIGPETGTITVMGTVRTCGVVPGRRKKRFELVLEDEVGGRISCVWFRGHAWISKLFSVGDRLAVHGKPQAYGGRYSFSHPDFDQLDEEGPALETGRIIALYPGTAELERVGLTSRSFRRILYTLFKEHGLKLRDPLPEWVQSRWKLMEGRVALRAVHFPRDRHELASARYRLKFEELFFIQLMLARIRHRRVEVAGPQLASTGPLCRRFLDEILPFELTGDQKKAVQDVLSDTATGKRMNRLVQGDVGSGKTVVGVAAMLHAIDHGYQAAFMAPTEILAEQHYANLKTYLAPLNVEVRLLVGGQKKSYRDEVGEMLKDGSVQVVVGTHAVIQDAVQFQRLGLAVVDEQHRFGVMQRASLFQKGMSPHMLLMTATPIPRSLAMTLYGDLDVSLIREKPAGRKPVETQLFWEKRRKEAYELIRSHLREGRQCYIVYPLVEESEKLDLKDAESGHLAVQEAFRPYTVDLVHGRMSGWEKDDVMSRFKAGKTDILVSTTVIEVGVDVSNASVMLIEHAERFGLSQLHQLRGRVGRGAEQSYCLLMADYRRSPESEERLKAMVRTDDGFEISEMDLKLRGAGDFFGTRQSGLPDLRIADITQDVEILERAREAAVELVSRDYSLSEDAHQDLRAYYDEAYEEMGVGLARLG